MPLTRNVKPDFFLNEELQQCEVKHGLPIRIAYIGLWTCCDREGRFVWKPGRLKRDILPYDDVDFEEVLEVLCGEGWVVKYSGRDANGMMVDCGVVPKFKLHQHINNREVASVLPEPPEGVEMAEIMPKRGRKTEPSLMVNKLNSGVKSDNKTKFTMSRGCHFRMDPGAENIPVLVANGSDMSEVVETFLTSASNGQLSISMDKVDQYQNAYSGVDVVQELKLVKQWLIDNPSRRKTAIGFGAFLNSWLSRSQNSYRPGLRTGGNGFKVVKDAPQMTPQAENEIARAVQMAGINVNKAPVGGASVDGKVEKDFPRSTTHADNAIEGELVK